MLPGELPFYIYREGLRAKIDILVNSNPGKIDLFLKTKIVGDIPDVLTTP